MQKISCPACIRLSPLICIPCWKLSSQQEPKNVVTTAAAATSDISTIWRQQEEIRTLKIEMYRLRQQLLYAQKKLQLMETSYNTLTIPDDMLARLIRLVHPDRHENSAQSNQVTAWLLLQRSTSNHAVR
jgi:hypothetical protein